MIHHGNNIEILRTFEDNSVDAIVTDPPYGLKFMGKKWDYDIPTVEFWTEAMRVLKPGGHILVACGTRTQHRMAVNIEDAGFEIRDIVSWIYASGFPKSLDVSKAIDKKPEALRVKEWKKWLLTQIEESGKTNKQINDECGFTATSYVKVDNKDYWSSNLPKGGKWQIMKSVIGISSTEYDWVEQDNTEERGYISPTGGLAGGTGNTVGNFSGKQLATNPISPEAKQWEGWGTALKPAQELWTLARKPLSEKTVAENVLKWGTGGLNIDECRVPLNGEPAPNGSAKRVFKSNEYTDQKIYGENKQTPETGRFPANVITDGSDEVLSLFPDTKSGKDCVRRKEGFFGEHGGLGKAGDIQTTYGDRGSAARFFYCAKASKTERNAGLEGMEKKQKVFNGQSNEPSKELKDVEERFTTQPAQNFHPTVKPVALMEYLVKLITPPNGTVLDPFAGSGTTGVACKDLGFDCILIEREEEYVEIIKGRIAC